MYGVTDGLYSKQSELNDEINERISRRNIPSDRLEPQLGIRPQSTKYSLMQIVDRQTPTDVSANKVPIYDIRNNFNPGNTMSPWTGYSSRVDDETRLRNQFFALQTCSQSAYIPSSQSDLYTIKIPYTTETQPFPNLFKEEKFSPFNPNTLTLGTNVFHNSTREQVLRSKLS